MMSNVMLQALACLRLLPDSTAAASEAAFVEAVERLQEYNIGLSPIQCLQVLLSPRHACIRGCCITLQAKDVDQLLTSSM